MRSTLRQTIKCWTDCLMSKYAAVHAWGCPRAHMKGQHSATCFMFTESSFLKLNRAESRKAEHLTPSCDLLKCASCLHSHTDMDM